MFYKLGQYEALAHLGLTKTAAGAPGAGSAPKASSGSSTMANPAPNIGVSTTPQPLTQKDAPTPMNAAPMPSAAPGPMNPFTAPAPVPPVINAPMGQIKPFASQGKKTL